ncbi:MAG: 3-deoxy-D-manno-octulosonic acid transferase [Bacteroidales bacterium]|nr:3-deoxy-D-manno-octulosonic acid transferase [Bacteroidales bacterium]
MRIIYTIGIWFYTLGIRVAALFGHTKARQMVRGWHRWRDELANLDERPVVWFHAASLGEFEQTRPVLERYLELHPEQQVLLTFFSPSGYEVRKNYPKAQAVCYLPPDLPYNVFWFTIRLIDLRAVFFVKYDFWFNYLIKLREANIPVYLFSAIFRPEQYFFKPWGRWYLQRLKDCYTHIFVQNEESLQLLRSHGVERCSRAGDTRFDRVHQIAEAAERNEVVEAFLKGHDGKVLVCGSTWPPDETLISDCVSALMRDCVSAIKIILAPHVISEEHLKQIEQFFPDSVRYSVLKDLKDSKDFKDHKVLIIDNIGLLSKLYRYADVAYIGGGFGVGIHNILEAVTFGKPVLFGPNYHKFQEAHDIIARGGGFTHSDHDLLAKNLLPLLTDGDAYRRASEACLEYMNANLGSTDIIIDTLEK